MCPCCRCPCEIKFSVASTKACDRDNCTLAKIELVAVSEGDTYVRVESAEISDVSGNVCQASELIHGHVEVTKSVECDLNGNGRLDVGDAVLCMRAAARIEPCRGRCDLNRNGRSCDIGDCVLILRELIR